VVTEHGGLLSHAAITAREFGLPAVLGVNNVTQTIKSGTEVFVDGSNGVIKIIEKATE
jgi:phosphoenolpyruvate-protein kinase (PTS system EI component)